MESFIIITALMLLGILLRRIPMFPEETGNVLNLFVIYVSLPALILIKIPALILSVQVLVPVAMPWCMLVVSAALILLLSRWLHWDRGTTGCMLLLIPLGNTSFLGIPMVKVFFGETAVSYAVLYDQLGSFLALATYGSFIISVYASQNAEKTSLSSIIRKILTFPPFIALVAAFVLRRFTYPEIVTEFLNMSASTLIPVIMVAVGFQLNLNLERRVRTQLGMGLVLKLAAFPVFTLLVCRLAGLDGEVVRVSVFESGMPPMVSAGALAISAGLSPSLAAALVGIGLVLSFATLPLLHYLILYLL